MRLIRLFPIFFFPTLLLAQLDTDNDYTGDWGATASWDGGATTTEPSYTGGEVDNDDDFNIYGYITEAGDLTFANLGNNNNVLTIYDTLVVGGDLTFQNNAVSLNIASSGVLIVFGNFSGGNKADLDNGGIMVVKGNLTLTGGQTDYTGVGGLYVDGTISGNASGDADAVDEDFTQLENDNEDIFEFVEQSAPDTPLPIELSDFQAHPNESGIRVHWTSATEINNEFYTLERSYNGENWETIITPPGAGNSSKPITYEFFDLPPSYGRIYYRLTQTDYDGTSETFPYITVLFENPEDGIKVFPSLVTPEIHQIRISNVWGEVQSQEIMIYDLQGRSARANVSSIDPTYIAVDVDKTLKGGLYLLKGQVNGVGFSQKIVIRQ